MSDQEAENVDPPSEPRVSTPPPATEAAMVISADAEVPPAVVPIETGKPARAAMHMGELRRLTQAAVGTNRIRTQLDPSRNVWQAWAGDQRFELAELKGEWRTETGALRRLANAKPRAQSAADQPRPIVASGANLIDALAKRHREQERKISHGGRTFRLIALVVVMALVAANIWLLIGRWHMSMPPRPDVRPDPRPLVVDAPERPAPRADPAPVNDAPQQVPVIRRPRTRVVPARVGE